VLLAKEEKVLQSMIDRLIGTGRLYGLNINAKTTKVMATIPNRIYDKSKTTRECGIFQIFG
jgi:hypothetical protein